MTKVIALETFTYKDNTVSMHKGQIAEIDDTIATELIADGYVAEYTGGGSGGVSPLLCTPSVSGGICSLDKTFKEIKEAFEAGSPIHILDELVYTTVTVIILNGRTVKDTYGNQFVANSDDGYPCFEV